MSSQSAGLQAIATSAGISGGGGGSAGGIAFSQNINGSLSPTSTTTTDTWTDAGTLTIPGAIASGDEYNFVLQTLLGIYVNPSAPVPFAPAAGIRIVDHNGAIVSGCLTSNTANFTVANTSIYQPVSLKGRYTFAASASSPVFKVQIRHFSLTGSGTVQAQNGYSDWTGSPPASGNEVDNAFYAYKNIGTTLNFVWNTAIKTVSDNNATVANGDENLSDTSGGAFTLKLPASPSQGNRVRFSDKKGSWTTNNLTIDRNGQNIMGVASNMALNVNRGAAEFVYSDATDGWIVSTNY